MALYTATFAASPNFSVDIHTLSYIRKRMTRYEALSAVRAAFPTEQAMADAFDVSQPTVWRWMNQSKQLPHNHVMTAERLTGVSRYDLRPDIFGARPDREAMVDQNVGERFIGTDMHTVMGGVREQLSGTV